MNAAPSFAPPLRDPSRSFQDMILTLHDFWSAEAGCVILQPYDMRMGAGTFHTATTLRALGPEPWNAAFVQPCRRPTDGRYGENPNRLQHYYQYQVILKPSPADLQELARQEVEQMMAFDGPGQAAQHAGIQLAGGIQGELGLANGDAILQLHVRFGLGVGRRDLDRTVAIGDHHAVHLRAHDQEVPVAAGVLHEGGMLVAGGGDLRLQALLAKKLADHVAVGAVRPQGARDGRCGSDRG